MRYFVLFFIGLRTVLVIGIIAYLTNLLDNMLGANGILGVPLSIGLGFMNGMWCFKDIGELGDGK